MAHAVCMQRALSVPALPGAAKIQNDLRILTERLARINDNLARKISSRNEYDKTIQETEGAYAKVRGCCLAALKRHHTAADPALSLRRVGPTLSLWRSICEVCPEPQVMVSFTYHGYTYCGRSWRARKRCCTCSSGSPPT